MENNTAKHFVLQLGSIVTLYLSVSFLLVLLFAIINLIIPDAIESYWQIESASSSVRLGIAMLIVFFPTYIILTRKVNVTRRIEANNEYLGLTKWLMYLSLLIGGGVLLGDLVAIILAFLEGEMTTRFLLKAGAMMVVVGGAFFYYLQDARGFWYKREKESFMYAIAMSLIVIATLITGFFYTETPSAVREMKLDETQISDLQQIQFRLEEAIALSSSTIPATLEEAYNGFPVPQAPEDRPAYIYEVTDKGFNLCATFSADSPESVAMMYKDSFAQTTPIKNANNWSYKAGEYCFVRVVN